MRSVLLYRFVSCVYGNYTMEVPLIGADLTKTSKRLK